MTSLIIFVPLYFIFLLIFGYRSFQASQKCGDVLFKGYVQRNFPLFFIPFSIIVGDLMFTFKNFYLHTLALAALMSITGLPLTWIFQGYRFGKKGLRVGLKFIEKVQIIGYEVKEVKNNEIHEIDIIVGNIVACSSAN